VAQFIGSPAMNVFEGILRREPGSARVAALGADWPVAGLAAGPDGQKVHYGIRPGDLTLAAAGIPAEVVVVEPTGAETELLLQVGVGADSGQASQQLILVMHGRTNAKPGDAVFLAIDGAKAHVFDGANGQRL